MIDIQRNTECSCLFSMIWGDKDSKEILSAIAYLSIEHFTFQDTRECFVKVCNLYTSGVRVLPDMVGFTNDTDMYQNAIQNGFFLGDDFQTNIIEVLLEEKTRRDFILQMEVAILFAKNRQMERAMSLSAQTISNSMQTNISTDELIEYEEAKVRAIKRIEDVRNPETRLLHYIRTGITSFDDAFIGLPCPALVGVAASSKGGKSAFTYAINRENANVSQLFVSTEVGAAGLVINLAAPLIGIERGKVLKGRTTDDEHRRIIKFLKSNDSNMNMKITTLKDVDVLISKIIAWRKFDTDLNKPAIVTIDFINDLIDKKNGTLSEDKPIRLAISRLKDLTIRYNLCIIVLTQLTKELERAKDKTPKLVHVFGSKALPDSADVMLLLDNKNIFKIDGTGNGDFLDVSLIVGKYKNEPTNVVLPLIFDTKEVVMFSPQNLGSETYPNYVEALYYIQGKYSPPKPKYN